jgi:alkylhydroperoxidase family enzyme
LDYDPIKTLNVIKMMAGTDDMYAATAGFIKALFQAQGIEAKTREMIMLRAAKILNSPYEWQANVILGKNAGLTTEEIDAAASDGPVVGIKADYVLVCRATDELSAAATLTDGKRVVLAVCTGWIGSVMMGSWRNQRYCYGLHVGDGV